MPSLQDAAPNLPISLEPYRAENSYAEPVDTLEMVTLEQGMTENFCFFLSSTLWGMDVEDHLHEEQDGERLVSYMRTSELNSMLRAGGEVLRSVLNETEAWESSGLSNYVLIQFHPNPILDS